MDERELSVGASSQRPERCRFINENPSLSIATIMQQKVIPYIANRKSSTIGVNYPKVQLRKKIHRSKPSMQSRLHPLLLTSPTSTRTQQTSNPIPTTKYSIPPSWSAFFGSVSGIPIIIYFRISMINRFTVGSIRLATVTRMRDGTYEPTAVVLVAAEADVEIGAETVIAGAAPGWVVATPSV
jgi:hypothetical protein